MTEENKPDSYEEYLRQEEQSRLQMETVRLQTIQRLRTDPAIQEYFRKFSPVSVEAFINGYAHKKMLYMEYADMYESIAEKKYTQYMERADHCLKEIQWKKLYDLRCQWGAELLKLETVGCSYDFLPLSHDIMNCPLISPISQEDFDLYMNYAGSEDFIYTEYFYWEYISLLRSTMQLEKLPEGYPNWFIYHNDHTDAGYYAMLPDTRHKKETFYCQLAFDEEEAKKEKKYQSGELQRPAPADPRPIISDEEYEHVAEFVRLFEDREMFGKFEKFEQYASPPLTNGQKNAEPDEEWLNKRVDRIISDLKTMKDVQLPVEECSDWRHGLINAWDAFEKEETIRNLPTAYDHYLFRLQNGIRMGEPEDENDDALELVDRVKALILRGRVLNGEPPDFNF
jgi:hypothetical protein